jgi:hypothetical protein
MPWLVASAILAPAQDGRRSPVERDGKNGSGPSQVYRWVDEEELYKIEHWARRDKDERESDDRESRNRRIYHHHGTSSSADPETEGQAVPS